MKLEFDVEGQDFSSAGTASSRIKKVLKQIGADSDLVRRISIASYEAELNIVIHAWRGKLSAVIELDKVEIYAIDEGPGIPDIDLAMKEGYSTAPETVREMGFGAGMGLPNMRRCSDELEIRSTVGKGTTVKLTFFTVNAP